MTIDVLVIGCGAAGLRASIAVREVGAEVVLVAKASPGRGTCTMVSAGSMSMPEEDPGEHFRATMETGRQLNDPALVSILCEESADAIRELERFGVELEFDPGRARAKPHAPPVGGLGLVNSLVTHARSIGVRFHPGEMVLALLPDDSGRVAVAYGIDLRAGELCVYHPGAVVLATGGAGALFRNNDNPVHVTGDGFRLAYDAGASLQDLEFVQMYPLGIAEKGFPHLLVEVRWTDICPVTNARGEAFLRDTMTHLGLKGSREGSTYTRDLLARAVGVEISEGRGDEGAVLMDFSGVTQADCDQDPYLGFFLGRVLRRFPYRERLLHVAPVAHHIMGGVVIDGSGGTGVPGLYAAGEVTGGVHGANRRAWNALADTIVFGRRAGRAAAGFASKGYRGSPVQAKLELLEENLREMGTGEPGRGAELQELRSAIQSTAEDLYVVRTAEGLRRAIERFDALKKEPLSASTPRQLMSGWELRNLLELGSFMAHSALVRRESRGAHYRADYPQQDDLHWQKHIVCAEIDGRPHFVVGAAP